MKIIATVALSYEAQCQHSLEYKKNVNDVDDEKGKFFSTSSSSSHVCEVYVNDPNSYIDDNGVINFEAR